MKKDLKDTFQYVLGGIISVGFFILLGLLIYKEIPVANNDTLNLVIGGLLGAFSTIVGYFYGSSKGSAEKNEILKKDDKV
jgi:fluoride ion exporter CrcB/FEX